jgi:uncharacterized protein
MSTFGLSKDQVELIKRSIQEVFGAKTDLTVYLFGSRAVGKNRRNSDVDLAFKSKDVELNKKISTIKMKLEESSLPFKCDIVSWDEIVHEYLPAIKKQKKVFWTKNDILIFSPWRICPLGYHWVKTHLKEGNSDLTNPHCRRNPSKKDILTKDEIQKISDLPIFKNPSVKASTNDMGYKGREKPVDYLINGWCAYWNDVLKPTVELHPNHLKALIASESRFIANPDRNKTHTAIGISQIMPATIKYLSASSKELRDHFIEISKEDAFDPNVNICVASRWLFRKYEIINSRRKNKLSWIEVLEGYKGIKTQKGETSDKIRSRIREEYSKLMPHENN